MSLYIYMTLHLYIYIYWYIHIFICIYSFLTPSWCDPPTFTNVVTPMIDANNLTNNSKKSSSVGLNLFNILKLPHHSQTLLNQIYSFFMQEWNGTLTCSREIIYNTFVVIRKCGEVYVLLNIPQESKGFAFTSVQLNSHPDPGAQVRQQLRCKRSYFYIAMRLMRDKYCLKQRGVLLSM